MKLSRAWLSNYLDLSDKADSEIEAALTLIGFEVEGIEAFGLPELPHVVVGEVRDKQPHPNADRLKVCSVEVGGDDLQQIVCGATNYAIGDRVPVALPGAVLPGNFKIKKSKLRGVESAGMMCSARELGLGKDHEGLMILEDKPEIGISLNALYPEQDTIFDIEVTPNRPDCLSHLGIARELCAYFDRPIIFPEVTTSSNYPFRETEEPLIKRVRVDAEEECPLYYAFSIRGVKIAPSPAWLKRAIESIGLRPINNVVDVTNYVLHETGQPLHAFDAAKIKGEELRIRQAARGERLRTLDEKPRELNEQMTVIADAERALVIAGVMGSVDAEVDNGTTDIVLEAAYFRASFIRWTSRRLGLSSDSSYRYERGVDPHQTEWAACRAIDLLIELAGGRLTGPPLQSGDLPQLRREIAIEPKQIRELCGFGPEDKEIEKVLQRLDLEVLNLDDGDDQEARWNVRIPSHRRDLERPVDLVEEFLRIYGTDQIPATEVRATGVHAEDSPIARFNREASGLLATQGYQEAMVYTLRSEEELRSWYGNTHASSLGLMNPLASDASHLRPSLLPGLLDTLRINHHRKTGAKGFFETGRVFRESQGRLWELLSVGFVIHLNPDEREWQDRARPDFYTAKRLVKDVFALAGIDAPERGFHRIDDEDAWQGGHAAKFGDFADGFEAKCGVLSFPVVKSWDLSGMVLAGSVLILPEQLEKPLPSRRYEAVSQYPAASRDLALIVDEPVRAAEVEAVLSKAVSEVTATIEFTVDRMEIFDVYAGTGLPEGKKSLGYALDFRSKERTLTDKEVNKAFERIQKAVTEGTGYTLRTA